MKKKINIIVVIFTLIMCSGCINIPHNDNHEHTYEFIPFEETHFKQYTCGCPSPEIVTLHFDNNNDGLCDECKYNMKKIKNYTFFPTEKSDLHRNELLEAYQTITNNFVTLEEYEIYNLINEEDSDKYDLDLFQVCYEKETLYYLKHHDKLYSIVPFALNNGNNHCITHVAITDVNNDGYIEIFTAVNSFAKNGKSSMSFIQVTDTLTGHFVEITDYDDITYFKENEQGMMSIYNANGIWAKTDDLNNGKLDEKYYDLADNLFDTPVVNTAKYEFKERYLETECKLFNVEITIDDYSIKFPYLFESTYTPPSFKINVKMKYLGKTFSYVNGNTYLDGATVKFTNETSRIVYEPWFAGEAITPFTIETGMVIDSEYKYNESLDNQNAAGVYDMVITYSNSDNNIKDTIIINDFLTLTR